MRYQPFTTLRTHAYELVRRSLLAAAAATAMVAPLVAQAGPILCGSTPGTPIPVPPPKVSMSETGTGILAVTGETFSNAAGGCPGFIASNGQITYTANKNDNLSTVTLDVDFNETLSYPVVPPPAVVFYVSASGSLNLFGGSNKFNFPDIVVSTFTEDRFKALDSATVDITAPPFSNPFDNKTALALVPTGLEVQDTLKLRVEIVFQQLDAAGGEIFSLDFPGSLVAQIVPGVPEPGSLVLMASALGGLAAMMRRKRRVQ
jgi:PEP-CTERM motif